MAEDRGTLRVVEVLPHDRVPQHRPRARLGGEVGGEVRRAPPHDRDRIRARQLERAAEPREPLPLVGPDVRGQRQRALLGRRVDRVAVGAEPLDDVQEGAGPRDVAEPRVREHDGRPHRPGCAGTFEAKAIGEEVEPSARAHLEEPHRQRRDRLEVPERADERTGPSHLVRLGRAFERRPQLVRVLLEDAEDHGHRRSGVVVPPVLG